MLVPPGFFFLEKIKYFVKFKRESHRNALDKITLLNGVYRIGTSCAKRKWKLKYNLIPCREASINNISISLEKWGRGGILRICSNQFAKSTGIQDDFSRLCNNVHFVWFLSILFESFQFLSILVNKSRFNMIFLFYFCYHVQGGFQLLDLIITELKSHMTC